MSASADDAGWRGAAWHQATRFKGDVTGPADSDWYGEHAEDQSRHSVVTEARTYDIGRRQRPGTDPAAEVNDSAALNVAQRPAVDHVYSVPARQQTYVGSATFYINFNLSHQE